MTLSILGYKQSPGSKIWEKIPVLTQKFIIDKVRPRQKGLENGAINVPETHADAFSETENQITYEAENYLKSVDDFANKEFTDIAREAAPLSLEGVEDDFNDIELNAKKDFDRYSLATVSELKKLRIEERTYLRDLKFFKEQNNLNRLASYPSSHILHIALLAGALLFESFINMFFFSNGSELGLLGGYLEALTISAINILVSFIIGRLALSYLHHVNKIKAFFAGMSALAGISAIILGHIMVAHYRDLLIIDPDAAKLNAVNKFLNGPFTFAAMDPIWILIFGIGIAVIALLDGYKYDDAYPGYGSKDRKYKEKAKALHNAQTAVRETILASLNKAEEDIKKRLMAYESRASKLDDLYTGAISVVDHFDNIYTQVDEIVHSTVCMYREANLRVRTDEAPKSFNRMPVVERLLRKDQYLPKVAQLKTMRDATTDRLGDIRRKASGALRFLAEETKLMNDRLEALTDEINKKANDQIKEDTEEV